MLGSNAATRPLEIVQIDHTLTDVVIDEAMLLIDEAPNLLATGCRGSG